MHSHALSRRAALALATVVALLALLGTGTHAGAQLPPLPSEIPTDPSDLPVDPSDVPSDLPTDTPTDDEGDPCRPELEPSDAPTPIPDATTDPLDIIEDQTGVDLPDECPSETETEEPPPPSETPTPTTSPTPTPTATTTFVPPPTSGGFNPPPQVDTGEPAPDVAPPPVALPDPGPTFVPAVLGVPRLAQRLGAVFGVGALGILLSILGAAGTFAATRRGWLAPTQTSSASTGAIMGRNTRTTLGAALLLLAAVVGLVGYGKISLETQVAVQVVYLASAGFGVVVLAATGAALLISDQLRADERRITELESALATIGGHLASGMQEPPRLLLRDEDGNALPGDQQPDYTKPGRAAPAPVAAANAAQTEAIRAAVEATLAAVGAKGAPKPATKRTTKAAARR